MRVVDVPEWGPPTAAMVGHRRRHRLRAVHRHPVPQQPRRGPGAAPRHPDGDRDRRSSRALRRPHRRRLDARHPADGSAGHDRLRLHRGADAAGRHGRVGDAAARLLGFAGRNIERLHVPFVSRNVQRVRHDTLVPLEPLHPAPAVGRRDRWARRAPGAGRTVPRHALRFPGREERPGRLHHPPGLRPARRRFRPGLLGADGAHRPGRVGQQAARAAADAVGTELAEVDGVALRLPCAPQPRGRHRTGARRAHHVAAGRGVRGPGRHPPRRQHPRRHRGHRAHRRRRRHGRGQSRHDSGHRRPAAAVLRRRAAGVVRAADDGLPVGRSCRSRP